MQNNILSSHASISLLITSITQITFLHLTSAYTNTSFMPVVTEDIAITQMLQMKMTVSERHYSFWVSYPELGQDLKLPLCCAPRNRQLCCFSLTKKAKI